MTRRDVAQVRDAGGRIIVSPDTNIDVIAATAAAGLVSSPGYFTPSEAFAAIRAGATALKLFPAEGASPAVLKAQLAVLPKDIPVIAVGGISPTTCGRGSMPERPGSASAPGCTSRANPLPKRSTRRAPMSRE